MKFSIVKLTNFSVELYWFSGNSVKGKNFLLWQWGYTNYIYIGLLILTSYHLNWYFRQSISSIHSFDFIFFLHWLVYKKVSNRDCFMNEHKNSNRRMKTIDVDLCGWIIINMILSWFFEIEITMRKLGFWTDEIWFKLYLLDIMWKLESFLLW